MRKIITTNNFDNIIFYGICAVFIGIIFHTPVSVYIDSLFPSIGLYIKGWKELLIGILLALETGRIVHTGQLRILLRDRLVILIIIYIAIHLVSLALIWNGLVSASAGLFIDLRYIIMFLLLYVYIRGHGEKRTVLLKIGVVGALIVFVFACIQVLILPYDFLEHIGYSKDTILPYLVVDRNYDYVRINSTLRGPNPLGAYALIWISLFTAWVVARGWSSVREKAVLPAVTFLVAALTTLWSSYSRSALIATVISAAAVLAVGIRKNANTMYWILGVTAFSSIAGGVFVSQYSGFVSQVFLHQNPEAVKIRGSNEEHVDSLENGFVRMLNQPFGAGIGSTGSASLYGNNALIVENQYLFIAHETGWLGLGFFLAICTLIMRRLWRGKKDWLSLGLFASGIGLFLIGILLPVWVDDTVSIVWWGLAAIAIGSWHMEDGIKQKAKRKI